MQDKPIRWVVIWGIITMLTMAVLLYLLRVQATFATISEELGK